MKKTLIVIACLFLSLMLFACTSSSEKSKDDKSNQNQETGTSPDIKETINDDPSDFLTAPYKAKAVEDMEIYSSLRGSFTRYSETGRQACGVKPCLSSGGWRPDWQGV